MKRAESAEFDAFCGGAELNEILFHHAPQLSARSIEWRLEEGTLVLRGRVTSFYQKQMAQTAARRLPGVERIVNELEVEHTVHGRKPKDDAP